MAKLPTLEQLKKAVLWTLRDYAGRISELTQTVSDALEEQAKNKQDKLTAGEGIALQATESGEGETVSVKLPTKALTTAEYEALSDEEKNGETLFVIKDDARQNELGGKVYSTEEQIIGTWIDGKPAYRSVIQFSNFDTPYNAGTPFLHDECVRLNIEQVISISGMYMTNADNRWWVVDDHFFAVCYSPSGSYFIFYNFNYNYTITIQGFLIVEYTKTTD